MGQGSRQQQRAFQDSLCAVCTRRKARSGACGPARPGHHQEAAQVRFHSSNLEYIY